jgi:ankyrin repeat protein
VDLLLEKGVDLEATTSLGETALHFAVGNDGHSTQAIVDLLLKRGADTSVRSGADDGHPLRTPLHYAAMNGNENYARSLLTHGADITACDYAGHTSLHMASETGNETLISLLLDHGADPTALDHSLCSARAYAESMDHVEIAALLEKAEESWKLSHP